MSEQVIILDGQSAKESAYKRIENMPMDGSMEIAFRPRKRVRTASQNALMWGARLKDISQQAWITGKQFSEDAWHEYLKREYLPEGDELNIVLLVKNPEKYQKWEFLPDGSKRLKGSTTELTTKGMTHYMEQCEAFAAQELGVRFSADRMAA